MFLLSDLGSKRIREKLRDMPDTAFESFKQELSRLVDIFHKNASQYKDQGYDESSLRNDFLNPSHTAPLPSICRTHDSPLG